MAKTKTAFFCQNCGAQHAKWVGQCSSCKQWNTLTEELLEKAATPAWKTQESSHQKTPKPLRLSEIDAEREMRLSTGDTELDQVLGGGLVPGSMTLIGGEPGIGKSTLLLQIALRLNVKTLYVSGEESQRQIKMRAERIAPGNDCGFHTNPAF